MAVSNDKKAMREMVQGIAMYLRGKSREQIEAGEGLNAFDLSLALEIMTGVDKEDGFDQILDMQKDIAKIFEDSARVQDDSDNEPEKV